MVRGFCCFKCDKCGHKFTGMDIEYMATAYSAPVKCPKCGSWHTMPTSLFSVLSKPIYKKIWRTYDEKKR